MNRHEHPEHYSYLEISERRAGLEVAAMLLALLAAFVFCILVLVVAITDNRNHVGQYCRMLSSGEVDTDNCITPEK